MLERNPTQILRKAVLGMLNRNKLRHGYMEPRLHIYTGPKHPHAAQLPTEVTPLPAVPRTLNGDFHFGLNEYAHPKSFQEGITPPPSRPEIQMMEIDKALQSK